MKAFFKDFLRKKKIVSILLTLVLFIIAAGTWVYVSKFIQTKRAEAAIKVNLGSGASPSILRYAGDGFARIVYMPGNSVVFVRCTNASCSTNVQTTITTGVASATSSNQNFALNSSGFARIVFRNTSNNGLYYIECTDADCTGASAINLDSVGFGLPSITLDSNGFPRIAYGNLPSSAVRLAVCSNSSCASPAPTLRTIATASVQEPKVQLDPTTGFPRIAYFNGSPADLMYVTCADADCATVNTPVTVDSTGTVGQYMSMVLSTNPSTVGRPMISYHDGTNTSLKYTFCGNTECSSGNSTTTIESANTVGRGTSLALGSDYFPRISFTDATNSTVRFLRCLDANCSSVSTAQVIDSSITASVGTGTMVDSSDFAHIVYYKPTSTYIASCLDLDCTNLLLRRLHYFQTSAQQVQH